MEEINLSGVDIKMPPLEEEIVKKKRGRPRKYKLADDFNKLDEKLEEKLDNSATSRLFNESSNSTNKLNSNSSNSNSKVTGKPGNNSSLDRYAVIKKITQYKNLFNKELAAININNLEKLNTNELNEKLTNIQSIVESRRSTNSSRNIFLMSLGLFENFDYLLDMRLKGLTQAAGSSEELLITVDEVALKHFNYLAQTDPIIRLCLGVGLLIVSVDGHNKKLENNINTNNNDKPTEMRDNNLNTDNYNDL